MNNNHIVILNEAQTQKINQWIKRNNKNIKIFYKFVIFLLTIGNFMYIIHFVLKNTQSVVIW